MDPYSVIIIEENCKKMLRWQFLTQDARHRLILILESPYCLKLWNMLILESPYCIKLCRTISEMP